MLSGVLLREGVENALDDVGLLNVLARAVLSRKASVAKFLRFSA